MTEKDDLDEHELAELTKEVAKRLERRGVLQAGAGLAAGGAAGYLASGRASAGSQQTGTIGSGGSPVDVVAEDIYGPGGQGSGDSVAFEAVETAAANITNETFVRAKLFNDKTGNSLDTFVNVLDDSVADNRNEFNQNGNGQLNPDESGEYIIQLGAIVAGNTSAGDIIVARIQNVDNASIPPGGLERRQDSPSGSDRLSWFFIVELSAGTNYELQVTNRDSSFDLLSGAIPQTSEIISSLVDG